MRFRRVRFKQAAAAAPAPKCNHCDSRCDPMADDDDAGDDNNNNNNRGRHNDDDERKQFVLHACMVVEMIDGTTVGCDEIVGGKKNI